MPVTVDDLLDQLDPPAAARTPDDLHDLTEVRAWARSRGYPIDESAAVPLQVLRTYRRVHAHCPPPPTEHRGRQHQGLRR